MTCGSVSCTLPPKPGAAKHDDEAMLLDRLDEDFDARDLHLPQLDRQRRAFFAAMRPARRSVMLPCASSVQKLPRMATSLRPEFEADAGRFERAAADAILQRIVAEQAQVPRPAARADARLHRNAAAGDAALGQRVEVRRLGRFEFGLAARLERQAAEAVGHEHHDLRVVLNMQFARQLVHVHDVFFLQVGRRQHVSSLCLPGCTRGREGVTPPLVGPLAGWRWLGYPHDMSAGVRCADALSFSSGDIPTVKNLGPSTDPSAGLRSGRHAARRCRAVGRQLVGSGVAVRRRPR